MKEEKTNGAIIAAISLAITDYLGANIHDEESGVLTITYVNKNWNNLNR